MHVKLFNKSEDYNIVKEWWEKHNWPVIPQSSLSTTGFIVKDENGEGVLVAWIYHTNSDIAWMEWIISNPAGVKR